jgi:hypothetical protein
VDFLASRRGCRCLLHSHLSYEEEDTCMSYEEDDTCSRLPLPSAFAPIV